MNPNVPQYEVTAPSGEYNGKTMGVQFNAGTAVLYARTVNEEYLKRSIDDTAREFLKWGDFNVRALTPEAQAVIDEWNAARDASAQQPKTSNVVLRAPRLKKNAVVAREGIYKTEA